MKIKYYILLILTTLFLNACSSVNIDKRKPHRVAIPPLSQIDRVIVARITYYNKKEAGGDRLASCNGRAKEGITVAAHPDFKFGTKILIPVLNGEVGDGQFICQDRGTAITYKRASHGKCYVFDVYIDVNSFSAARRKVIDLEKIVGEYTNVYILKPTVSM